MKTRKHLPMELKKLALVLTLVVATLAVETARSQTTIVSDSFTAANVNSGFAPGEGANSAIYPPYSNRITGTVASSLRYIKTGGTRANSLYTINSNRLRVGTEATIGRFSISANGVTPFNFAPALGTAGASPTDPAVYEVKISMRNEATSAARLSFGIATAEGDVGVLDFGVQIYRVASGNDYYTVQKRIDDASSGAGDVNAVMVNTAADTAGTMVGFLIRITDAGAETSTYSSRVQVSMDNGATWIYDTSTDSALPNGFRFDAPGRVFIWDQASNTSGNCFYDSFSVTSIYAPPPPPDRMWTGAGADDNWSTPANWGGTVPGTGEPLLFGLAARLANNNDLALDTPSLTFSNGGFALGGNALAIDAALNNLAGINTLSLPLDWPLSGGKSWQLAPGSELILSGNSTWTTTGDHVLYGGGTLRLRGSVVINQNPAFILSEGRFVLDGGAFNSLGGFRIGSLVSASAPVEVVVSNGAALTLETSAANLRVGDGASAVASRLMVNNGTVTMFGGSLGIPYAAGCTGQVLQTGGLVKDCYVAFSDSGAGVGTYEVANGILEPLQIRKDNAAGTAVIRFQNAMLRPAVGAVGANFMGGLDLAEIQSGGLTLDVTSPVTIAQPLTGAGGITKVNLEAVSLTGANNYAGNTLVQEGKLVLPTVQTNAAAVQVAHGAELGVIRTAASATLTAGSLSLGASTLSFDLGSLPNPTTPLLQVNTLTASGGDGSVSINVSGGLGLTPGSITLVDYSGSIGGSGYSAFALGSLPPGVSASLVNNTANSSIDLNITAAPGLRWTGANGSSWDYGTVNWFDEGIGGSGSYTDNQPTRFLDGAATGIVELTSTFTPSALTVSNNALLYVFSGGGLNVPRLVKLGDGSLTRVDGGADLIPEIELNVGSFVSSNTYDAAFPSVLTDTSAGQGRFVKTGTGVLTVSSNSSSFDGAIVIQEGILKLGADGVLGSTNGSTTIASGATLDVNNFVSPQEPITVSGSGVGDLGAITDTASGGGVQHNLTDVTLAGDTTVGCPTSGARWDIRVRSGSGPGPGLRGNGFNLTKVGPGTVSLACQRHNYGPGVPVPYWEMNLGNVLIAEGGLTFAESLSLGNPSKSITINPGANVSFYDLNVTNPIVRSIFVTDASINCGGAAEHTNVLNGPIQLTGACSTRPDQAALIINGAITGSGSLNVSANLTGRVYLNGTNTYTGDTTVTNGLFGGSGVIAGNLIMLGGTNSPGWGVGVLTVHGNVSLGGRTIMELNRDLSPNCDRFAVGGSLAFGGDLDVVLAPGAAAPQAGDVYQLFSKGGSGAFTAVSLPDLSALPAGLSWHTSDLLTLGRISVSGSASSPTIQPPHIAEGSLVLTGAGGPANGSYTILTSTNVAAPLVDWITNTLGTFNGSGGFSNAVPLIPGEVKRFFLIKQP